MPAPSCTSSSSASRNPPRNTIAARWALRFRRKGSRVERHFHSVYDLTPERVGIYDLVFCASVLLHLTDPLRAMYGIRRVCRDQAIISTGIDTHLHVAGQSRALFIGTATGQAFWLPTMTCLEKMLLAAGFARVERVSTFHLKSVDGTFDTPHGTLRAFVAGVRRFGVAGVRVHSGEIARVFAERSRFADAPSQRQLLFPPSLTQNGTGPSHTSFLRGPVLVSSRNSVGFR